MAKLLVAFLALLSGAHAATYGNSISTTTQSGITYGISKGGAYGINSARYGTYGGNQAGAYAPTPMPGGDAAPVSTACHCRPRWVGRLFCESTNDGCECLTDWIEQDFCQN